MTKNKKIAAIVTSLSCVAVITVGTIFGVNAFFVDRTSGDTSGKAGEVRIAEEQISINNASTYVTGNGVTIKMGRFMTTGADIAGSDGWIPEGGSTVSEYTPVWMTVYHTTTGRQEDVHGFIIKDGDSYYCDACDWTGDTIPESQVAWAYLFPDFFRTANGQVAYCMDNGKLEPSDGVCNMSTPVSIEAKRVLLNGYPQKHGSEYDITDAELEWCTQQALYIVEGTAFLPDGTVYNDNKNTLEDFGKYFLYQDANKTEAEKLFEVIKKLVDYSTDSTIEVESFRVDASQSSISTSAEGVLAGPFNVIANMSSDITLSANNGSVEFRNSNGDKLTQLDETNEFYIFIPNSVTADVEITISAPEEILPSYYYWSGRPEEQKMAIASLMPATITAHVNTADEIMPGDVVDISWTVENLGNKSILTRNTIYIFWDYDNDANVAESNGNNVVYLYKQNTTPEEIRADMLTQNPSSSNLIDLGGIKTFSFNGKTYAGYRLTVYGDYLDGVGNNAETGIADGNEVNYGSEYDDTSAVLDVVSYKLALSQWANIHTSGQQLRIVVVTEALQYQNTNDGDWIEVGTTEWVGH